MSRLREITFIIITCLVLAAVVVNLAVRGFLAGDDAPNSYLEGRTYQQMPELGGVSLFSGEFQTALEQCLADAVPCRDAVLLMNAKLQRELIGIANMPFGFEAYHTFYDSDYLVAPTKARLFEAPYTVSRWGDDLDYALERYAALFEAYPSIRWHVALVDRSGTCESSPAAELVSDFAGYRFFFEAIQGRLADRCGFIDLSNLMEQPGYYFATDHHWQVEGSTRAYETIMQSLGRNAIRFGPTFSAYDGKFYGALARSGLDVELFDQLDDVSYDHGTYTVIVDGREKPMSYLCEGFSGKTYEKADAYANVYADYFHGDPGLLEIRNEHAQKGTLLIVGDSFTNNMDRFFAESYQTVLVADLRHYDGTMADLLDSYDIHDCVFIMSANNMISKTVADKLAVGD